MSGLVHHSLTNYQLFAPRRTVHGDSAVARAAALLKLWSKRVRGRHELARLTESELKDIGLTRGDVYEEIDKPFWRD
jgi:uncharacterized protein YjiS (DUF1127 family)